MGDFECNRDFSPVDHHHVWSLGELAGLLGQGLVESGMISSWSFHPRSALVGFTSCCVVLVLVSLSLLGMGENVSPRVQYSLFALFCVALGFAAFSLAREQSKTFGVVALLVGLFSFISPFVLFLWFPGMLRH